MSLNRILRVSHLLIMVIELHALIRDSFVNPVDQEGCTFCGQIVHEAVLHGLTFNFGLISIYCWLL